MPTLKGHVTINSSFKVSADYASEIYKTLTALAEWMRETHFIGTEKCVELMDYYFTKVEEFNNPADPEEGTTG